MTSANLVEDSKPHLSAATDLIVQHDAPSNTAIQDEALSTDANALDLSGVTAAADCQDPQLVEVPSEPVHEGLSADLQRLIESVSAVEELSRLAREAAVGDLAQYQALVASSEQYTAGLQEASTLEDSAATVLQSAFGQSARAAAEVLLADSKRVRHAFAELAVAWQQRADEFLHTHPDVELLVIERRAEEQEARRQEEAAARLRRRDSVLSALSSALEALVFPEARRAVAVLEREFADDVELVKSAQTRLRVAIREEKDLVAREALERAADQCEAGDLEAALATLEQVDVDGLSLEVSQDVFGRWCDVCSRLAQASGAYVERWAPRQGRGLICIVNPRTPREVEVLSSLGMGPDYFAGAIIKQVLSPEEKHDPGARRRAAIAERILRELREFRAADVGTTGWATYAVPNTFAVPVHH
ncbi:MAG: hypothetical protein JOZ87_25770 [Chloroflexi bacterium]|nr:hypothetical protein [Chloroflexota bacterium]